MKNTFEDLELNDIFVYSLKFTDLTLSYVAIVDEVNTHSILIKDLASFEGESDNIEYQRLYLADTKEHGYEFVEFIRTEKSILDELKITHKHLFEGK